MQDRVTAKRLFVAQLQTPTSFALLQSITFVCMWQRLWTIPAFICTNKIFNSKYSAHISNYTIYFLCTIVIKIFASSMFNVCYWIEDFLLTFTFDNFIRILVIHNFFINSWKLRHFYNTIAVSIIRCNLQLNFLCTMWLTTFLWITEIIDNFTWTTVI